MVMRLNGDRPKMKRSAVAVIFALLLAIPAGSASAQPDPHAAIVAIVTVDTTTNRGAYLGSGFLVGSDGVVLTSAHVVWRALHDPARYHLLVAVGREFYSASVVCSTYLANWAPGEPDLVAQRDIAVLKLAPSDFSFSTYFFIKGDPAETFQAHTGPLPVFSVLPLADRRPAPGTAVHSYGWSGVSGTAKPTSYRGRVDHSGHTQDGASVTALLPAADLRGMSGSPILDAQERVVGQVFWGGGTARYEWATDVSELRHPCGSVSL
jgi:hypothetical protein